MARTPSGPTDPAVRRLAVLLLEDQPDLAEHVANVLPSSGYDVRVATRIEEVPAWLDEVELLILDVDVARTPGHRFVPSMLELIQALRFLRPDLGILTLARTHEPARSARLADLDVACHLQLPLGRAQLDVHAARAVAYARERGRSKRRDVRLDPSDRLVHANGASVRLAPMEFAFLEALERAAPKPVSREELATKLWSRAAPGGDRAVDVIAFKTRRKLAHHLGLVGAIRTVRGVGYRYVLPRSPAVQPDPASARASRT